MSFAPKISVIIPVYKGANYVGEAIESVLAQTYKNIEIIVVDDGSPDDGATRQAVERYIPRVRYIHQENRGVAGALNTGIQAMTGDYFSWLSHDDLFVRDKTAKQVAFLEKLGRDDVVIFSDYTNVDPDNNRLYDVEMDHKMLTDQPLLAVLRGCLNGCTMLLPRKVFDVVGYFDEKLRYTQDYDYWDRVEDHFPLVHVPGKVVRQRLHPHQDSHNPAALVECNTLWLRLIDKRSPAKQSLISGSPLKFLKGMRGFISQTPYADALRGIDERLAACVEASKVSIVLDVAGDREGAERAVAAAANQSHKNVELIIVERTEGAADLPLLEWAQSRIALVALKAIGKSQAEARNLGLEACTGAYICFASETEAFMPSKVEMQLTAMQESGAFVSHTSVYASCPELSSGYFHVAAGAMSGRLYPQLISSCPIVVETLMINALVAAEGFRFVERKDGGDARTLIGLAQRYDFLGVPHALSLQCWTRARTPLNFEMAVEALADLQLALECDPITGGEREALQALDARIQALKQAVRQQRQEQFDVAHQEAMIVQLFAAERVPLDLHATQ